MKCHDQGSIIEHVFVVTNHYTFRHKVENMKLTLVIGLTSILASSLAQQNGLQIRTTDGPTNCRRKVKAGDEIIIHYHGTLTNGKVFDSSYERNQPFNVQIGVGKVIKGWDQGIVGMCPGEKRQLVIPPELGYGDRVSVIVEM